MTWIKAPKALILPENTIHLGSDTPSCIILPEISYGKEEVTHTQETAKTIQITANKKVAVKDGTLQYGIYGVEGAARVYMKPASEGTGINAGSECIVKHLLW